MKEKFWKFMDSAKGFWILISGMIILGIAYMVGGKELIDWVMKIRKEEKKCGL